MKVETARIKMIKELYNELKFEDDIAQLREDEKTLIYQKNQDLSEEIISLINTELEDNSASVDALFWKIKIHAGPHFEDTSVILSTAQEIIDRFIDDKESVFSAFDWLAWAYDSKLDLKAKAIEVLHDKLIEISLLKDKYALRDREFGETYYVIARMYKEQDDLDSAASFYKLAFEHFPDHYYTSFQGGLLFLSRGEYEIAYAMLEAFYTFHGNEYSADIAKKIEENYLHGSLDNRWDLLYLMYCIVISYPIESGYKSVKEFGNKYFPIIEKLIVQEPDNVFLLRMKAQHYLHVDINTKKAFELLDRSFKISKAIIGNLYFEYYELGKKYNIDVHANDFKYESEGMSGYNLMTSFLEKGDELYEKEAYAEALTYYKISKEVGMATYPKVENYLKKGIGDKRNNNPHGYALLCNSLGIAIYNIALLEDKGFTSDECKLALRLHKEGYDYSPFWQNLDSGMRLATAMHEYEKVAEFGEELLSYYEEYTATWLMIQTRLLKNLIETDQYDEIEKIYFAIRSGFENKKIESEYVIAEIISFATEYFTYLRYTKLEFEKTIQLADDFFTNSIYMDLNEEIACINYWYTIAWSYHGLKNTEKAKYYFDLMIDKYQHNENYTDTITAIPEIYTYTEEQKRTHQKFFSILTDKPSKVDRYPFVFDTDVNALQLEKLVNYLGVLSDTTFGVTLEDDTYCKVFGKELLTNVEEIDRYDTLLDIYIPEHDITIRYNLIDLPMPQNFFTRLMGNTRKKYFYVYIFDFKTEGQTADCKDFDEADKVYKELAQAIWNRLMTNLKLAKGL